VVKYVRRKLSDGKLGHLSTTPNNNISIDFIPASYIFLCMKMSAYESKKRHLRKVLLYHFSVKKSAVESHRLLVETYSGSLRFAQAT